MEDQAQTFTHRSKSPSQEVFQAEECGIGIIHRSYVVRSHPSFDIWASPSYGLASRNEYLVCSQTCD